jgi:hypothetical protein
VSLNRTLTEGIPLPHGNGHGDGHAAEPTAVSAPGARPEALEQGDGDGTGG